MTTQPDRDKATDARRAGVGTSVSLKDRIRDAYEQGIRNYYDNMAAVFPDAEYPKAFRYSQNGGPPGCVMAYGKAVRALGGMRTLNNDLWLPPRQDTPGAAGSRHGRRG